ncbi:unnamed protein product [Cyclocybe aegerita]|uniref:Uncharacterized protein n=1 Tax=Cyclocybe aegerita TaxID=1973307 RepID=A0A8S0WUN9_CYCAE|nr:unnamed protein product [Cyclocybe aegerita]
MPPRITQDPHLVQPPDFESEQFRALYATLATAERTVDAIIADSQNAWTQNNDAQVEQDHAEEEEARAAQEQAKQEAAEAEKRERENKRPKIKSFTPNKTVGKLSSRRPSRYAIHKIEQLERPVLRPRGRNTQWRVLADGENVLAAAAYKPSTKVVQDENLEWRQIIKAKDYMLEAMVDAGWPEEHVMALGVFFLELDKHPISDLEGGETAVLLYQARIRCRWMEDLKSTNDEEVFDISVVNDKRLDEMYSEVLNLRQAQGIKRTFAPANKSSIDTFSEEYNHNVQIEFERGRYIGPASCAEVEALLGPFQTSPLSVIPKPAKPGKFRLIQNLSYPLKAIDITSINSGINSNQFPCTWGTFSVICLLISRLPPGSQAAVRDVKEAY